MLTRTDRRRRRLGLTLSGAVADPIVALAGQSPALLAAGAESVVSSRNRGCSDNPRIGISGGRGLAASGRSGPDADLRPGGRTAQHKRCDRMDSTGFADLARPSPPPPGAKRRAVVPLNIR